MRVRTFIDAVELDGMEVWVLIPGLVHGPLPQEPTHAQILTQAAVGY